MRVYSHIFTYLNDNDVCCVLGGGREGWREGGREVFGRRKGGRVDGCSSHTLVCEWASHTVYFWCMWRRRGRRKVGKGVDVCAFEPEWANPNAGNCPNSTMMT